MKPFSEDEQKVSLGNQGNNNDLGHLEGVP